MLEPGDLVLDPEFLALEFGDFGVGRGRVVHRLGEFRLEGPVLGVKLAKVRLKTHAILHRWLWIAVDDDIELGTCRTLAKGFSEDCDNVIVNVWGTGEPMPKLDVIQEVQLRNELQNAILQHRDLDTAITSLEQTGTGDQLQLRRLKKMKLDLKDKIQQIENMLIPDIIA